MTPRLTRLRIAGFKSFAEPVSLDILPGLTGIVGPNGCGKSNVAEALRWAMGETSARSLRGGEMDDVIFAGTSARASRNLAEVTITLEARGAALPPPFAAEPELQVTRRIERGAGSMFRANGRELRARDVQTLYADLASGARSSGMVSQGRVADLVRARPEERRQVLEEAAGITGLHARRHEAELKLRAAEQNVARAADLRSQLEGTREGLRRQARQAARYRALSGLVRAAEAEHLAILHAQATAALDQAQAEQAAAERALAASALHEAEAARALAGTEDTLPRLRERASESRSTAERYRFTAEALAAEAERAAGQARAEAARLGELASDLESAARAEHDAQQAVQRLAAELEQQAAGLSAMPDQAELAEAALGQARAALGQAQTQAEHTARRARDAAAEEQQARKALQHADAKLAGLRAQQDALLAELAACRTARIGHEQLAAAASDTEHAEATLLAARARLDAAETARMAAADGLARARSCVETAEARQAAAAQEAARAASRLDRLRATRDAAERALAGHRSRRVQPGAMRDADQAADRAEAALAHAEAALDQAERGTSLASADAASALRAAEDARATRALAQAALSAAQSRAARIAAELAAAESSSAAAEAPDEDACAQAEALCVTAEQAMAANRAEQARAREAHRSAGQTVDRARAALSLARADAARLGAEADGLASALAGEGSAADLLGSLDVPSSLTLAVGAALGDAAGVTLEESGEESGRFWRALPPLAPGPLPPGSVALASLLAAPEPLARLLSHTALLDEGADGDALQPTLPPGMVAVDRHGACWRWDGLVTQAGTLNRTALRLGLQRRLSDARAGRAAALQTVASAESQLAQADSAASAANLDASSADHAAEAAEAAWRQACQAAERLAEQAALARSRRAALLPVIDDLNSERDAIGQAVAAAEARLAGLPDADGLDRAARSADARRLAAERAVAGARAAQGLARSQAAARRQAAHALAGEAARTEALFEAAADARRRAEEDFLHAADAASAAEAALAALPDLAVLAAGLDAAESAASACLADEAEARRLRQLAETALDQSRQAQARLHEAHLQAETRYAGLCERSARTGAEAEAAEGAARQAAETVSALPDSAQLAASAEAAASGLELARLAAAQAEAAALSLRTERAVAERAQADARAQLDFWAPRLDEARSRRAALAARHAAAEAAWRALASAPDDAAEQRARAAAALDAAEHAHRLADAELAAAEERVRALAAALRDAASEASARREHRMPLHALCQARETALGAVLARAAERLGEAATLPPAPDPSPQAEERARRKHERLCREREEVGPVNLRAELELDELDQRLGALARECQELDTAVAKLRGAIGHLNREGRERLLAVFAEIDRHFRALFTRMMGGGRAHLAMTGADDPLAAGLEIFAEPPGKKLSSLSLLSGGEQALTALSLIFAIFRCAPAPLCVLDEVDAPLDDANVERFCTLLDDVVRDTGTSFLVVTHHQLTMSRMDRLFGVTMQERGVSRILSVDLQSAAALASPLLQAAE